MFDEPKELTLIDALRRFLPLCIKHLKLKTLPKIQLCRDLHATNVPTFGQFQNGDKLIRIDVENRHPVDILRTLAHELVHYGQNERGELDSESWHTGSDAENEANAEAGVIMRMFNTEYPEYLKLKPVVLPDQIDEKWSEKYKSSIDCNNPKGFSQRAHCQGRKKTDENFADGRNPGRKGLAKRSGVDCEQSVTKLRDIAKHSSGERQRMAHWCANMKSGKNK